MPDLRVIPVALSPGGYAMIERGLHKLRESLPTEEERHQCDKILAELQVAKGHAEPVGAPSRTSRVARSEPTPSEAERIADKMAKAARKAVEE